MPLRFAECPTEFRRYETDDRRQHLAERLHRDRNTRQLQHRRQFPFDKRVSFYKIAVFIIDAKSHQTSLLLQGKSRLKVGCNFSLILYVFGQFRLFTTLEREIHKVFSNMSHTQ